MINIQEQVKKAFCCQKWFWPFTVWTNCSSDLKSFTRSLEQFFLTVGQNNFDNELPIFHFKNHTFFNVKYSYLKYWTKYAKIRLGILLPHMCFLWRVCIEISIKVFMVRLPFSLPTTYLGYGRLHKCGKKFSFSPLDKSLSFTYHNAQIRKIFWL